MIQFWQLLRPIMKISLPRLENKSGSPLVEHPSLWYNRIRARTEVPARTCEKSEFITHGNFLAWSLLLSIARQECYSDYRPLFSSARILAGQDQCPHRYRQSRPSWA